MLDHRDSLDHRLPPHLRDATALKQLAGVGLAQPIEGQPDPELGQDAVGAVDRRGS